MLIKAEFMGRLIVEVSNESISLVFLFRADGSHNLTQNLFDAKVNFATHSKNITTALDKAQQVLNLVDAVKYKNVSFSILVDEINKLGKI